jgi:hypothetical protein
MATDYYFVKGGPCIPECLPICDTCTSTSRAAHMPFPKRFDGTYARGHFVGGRPFNPQTNESQGNALRCVAPAVGDFISLMPVPALHTLQDVYMEVEVAQKLFQPYVTQLTNNMAGFTFDVEVRRYDAAGVMLGLVALPAAFQGVNGAVVSQARAPVLAAQLGYFVPSTEHVEVGLKIVTLPTAVTLDKISGWVGIAGHIFDYQIPVHL